MIRRGVLNCIKRGFFADMIPAMSGPDRHDSCTEKNPASFGSSADFNRFNIESAAGGAGTITLTDGATL